MHIICFSWSLLLKTRIAELWKHYRPDIGGVRPVCFQPFNQRWQAYHLKLISSFNILSMFIILVNIVKSIGHLYNHFQIKDFDKLKYLLGIEMTQFNDGIVISQKKYIWDILEKITLMNSKPMDTFMDHNTKLQYLTINRLDIFSVSLVNQFLNFSCESNWNVVICILKYIKRSPGERIDIHDN